MKKIELVKGIHSSVLGFGCAPILGSAGAAKAKRALEVAIECGINHFDLARSYGYGDAEKFVGKAIKGKRERIVLASKFGIKANFKARALRPVKPLARYVIDKIKTKNRTESIVLKPSGGAVSQIADNFHYRIALNGKEMRKSLEQSLKELSTDYLDYFFIHEPLTTIEHIDELMLTAEVLKKEGKIRAWGLAFMRHQQHLHQAYLKHFDILQFDNSPGAYSYNEIVESRGKESNIIFSPLRGGSNDLKPAEKLLTLAKDFSNSVILCSMFNEQHMRSNAALFDSTI